MLEIRICIIVKIGWGPRQSASTPLLLFCLCIYFEERRAFFADRGILLFLEKLSVVGKCRVLARCLHSRDRSGHFIHGRWKFPKLVTYIRAHTAASPAVARSSVIKAETSKNDIRN